jgi:hypothetical protein
VAAPGRTAWPAGRAGRPGLQAGNLGDGQRDHGRVCGWRLAGPGGPWINGYGKLRRITGRYAAIVHLCLCLAAAVVVIRQFIQHARRRPTTERLK